MSWDVVAANDNHNSKLRLLRRMNGQQLCIVFANFRSIIATAIEPNYPENLVLSPAD